MVIKTNSTMNNNTTDTNIYINFHNAKSKTKNVQNQTMYIIWYQCSNKIIMTLIMNLMLKNIFKKTISTEYWKIL